jgi:competence protein ComEC
MSATVRIRPNENTNATLYQPLVLPAFALAAGVIIDRYQGLGAGIWVALFGIAIGIWFAAAWRGANRFANAALLTAIACAGGGWHYLRWHTVAGDDLCHFTGESAEPAIISGIVLANPVIRTANDPHDVTGQATESRTRFTLSVTAIRSNSEWRAVSGRCEVFVRGAIAELRAGHQVKVAGKLSLVGMVGNPGEFDFRQFLRTSGIHTWISVGEPLGIEVSRDGHAWLRLAGGRFKANLNSALHHYLSPDQAGLASAMLLGNRDEVDYDERGQFMVTGTVHLLAISGLHVGILASFVVLLSRIILLPRNLSFLVTVIFVLFYAWLVDFRPPVLRAAVLICIYCFARWVGREPLAFNSLALAAIIVIGINPSELFSTGAQLSFLAVGTMVFAARWLEFPKSEDPLDELIARARPWHEKLLVRICRNAWSGLMVSTVVWLFAIPLVAIHFHVVTPISMIANPPVMLPVTLAMASGFVILLTGWLLPPVATVAGWFCGWSLDVMRWLIEFFGSIPGGYFWTCGPHHAAAVIFYAAVLMAFVVRPRGVKPIWALSALAGWLVLCWWLPRQWEIRSMRARETLACTVIDVGHGNCILLELPGGKNLLYDCGSLGSPQLAARCASSVLWHHRIDRLHAIIISHADADHFNGIAELMRYFCVERCLVSRRMKEQESRVEIAWLLERLQNDEPGLKLELLDDVAEIAMESAAQLELLSPVEGVIYNTDNEMSIVLRVSCHGRKVLLTGDVEGEALDRLLDRPNPDGFELVTMPHHGSINSRPADFLAWTRPKVAVVCSRQGMNDSLESQLPPGLMEQTNLFHTGRDGAVRMLIEQDGHCQTSAFVRSPW